MSSQVTVDPAKAQRELERAWIVSSGSAALRGDLRSKIGRVIEGPSITYRYILITGILAKLVNARAHPRALQKHSTLSGAYDARSLCHSVVVPFEHEKGDLWGLSNEPFVNKPARHLEHDKNNRQLRDKLGATLTHEVLEWARTAPTDDLREALSFIMKLGRNRLAAIPEVAEGPGLNLVPLRQFVRDFLREGDGGARLVSVVATFTRLLNPEGEVKVYSPNVSDKFGKTAGDVELYVNKRLIAAFECKDREFTTSDISHGLRKAVDNGVREYTFVAGPGLGPPEADPESEGQKVKVDSSWISINEVIESWTVALNPIRRGQFGRTIIQYLLEMRRREVARVAEETWNRYFNS